MDISSIPILATTGFVTIAIGLVILLWGFIAAKQKSFNKHRQMMILAVIVLFLFLIQYIVRAFVLHQETPFTGADWIKYYIYFPTLIVHITGAIITIVLILRHLTRSLKEEQRTQTNQVYFPKDYRSSHRKLGRITFLLWLFSYIGGIIIFIMLYIL